MAVQRLSVSSLARCNFGMTCNTRSSTSAWQRGCVSSCGAPRSLTPSSSSCSSKVVMYLLITLSQSKPKELHMKIEEWLLTQAEKKNKTKTYKVHFKSYQKERWPAVLENNVGGDPLVFHQIRNQTTLHLRLLTEHWLNRYLDKSMANFKTY